MCHSAIHVKHVFVYNFCDFLLYLHYFIHLKYKYYMRSKRIKSYLYNINSVCLCAFRSPADHAHALLTFIEHRKIQNLRLTGYRKTAGISVPKHSDAIFRARCRSMGTDCQAVEVFISAAGGTYAFC